MPAGAEATSSSEAASDCIRRRLGEGAPWDACDAFREAVRGLDDTAVDASLLYWGALAHARAGSTQQAEALLGRALAAAAGDAALKVEVLSLRGRLWKDRLHRAPDEPSALVHAQRARADYLAAWALRHDPFPGINAASLSMRMGEAAASHALAEQVLDALDAGTGTRDAWGHATAGEACLLLGRDDEAMREYAAAFADAPSDAGSVASMRRQLLMLAKCLPSATAILRASPEPTVVSFAAAAIDAAEATRGATHRIAGSPAAEDRWRTHLRRRLEAWPKPLVVFTSAACGAELVLIEEALGLGAEVNVVLPFDPVDFVRLRVAPGGAGWVERFDAALGRVARVVLATEESHLGDDVLFEHARRLLEGLASLRAAQLETRVSTLVVSEGGPTTPPAAGRAVPLVPDAGDLPPAEASRPDLPDRPKRTLKTLLFADIAGFGRLHDAYAPLFHASFLRIVDEQLRACATPPLEANTWGDALYAVFPTPDDGAAFALPLLDRMLEVDWAAKGLSASSQIRIALHTGPVFCGFDPIMGRDNYFGSSVTKAARIEPVTPAGTIYASEAFAASLVGLRPGRYAFEYMGHLALAKGHGESRIYRLDRAA